jgi:alkylation response protein AidB-like acyl-CoA dehydrogenase
MQINITAADRLFRDEVRTWLEANRPRAPRPREGHDMRVFDLAWQQTLYAAGWAGISWPTEYGGRGLSVRHQIIWFEELARARVPRTSTLFVGNNHAGPTLIARGSEEQKREHLPRILRGDVVWCQGFSEPNAGSDLASLRTSARIEGDRLIVNGSKIWTSYAQVADYQELLVRTQPSSQKHRGISWAICDMKAPGITIYPIISITGIHHFNQVFYEDVEIPLDQVVGGLDNGWSVAMATLGFERGTAFIPDQIALIQACERLAELARSTPSGVQGRSMLDDERVADDLAELRADIAALQAMTYAGLARPEGSGPGAEASLVRLLFAELVQKLYRLAQDVRGAASLLMSETGEDWTFGYLDSFHHTIAAGTSEIQRNIIAERVLGLPSG